MEHLHGLVIKAAEQVNGHPGMSVFAGIAASLVAILQSSQTVASSLIALVTSIAGLITAVLAVRNAWRNRNKTKE